MVSKESFENHFESGGLICFACKKQSFNVVFLPAPCTPPVIKYTLLRCTACGTIKEVSTDWF